MVYYFKHYVNSVPVVFCRTRDYFDENPTVSLAQGELLELFHIPVI